MHRQDHFRIQAGGGFLCLPAVNGIKPSDRDHEHIRIMQDAHLLIAQHLAQVAQMHDPQSFRFDQEQQGFSPLCPLLVIMVPADSRDPDPL